jgi:hypothetical protein
MFYLCLQTTTSRFQESIIAGLSTVSPVSEEHNLVVLFDKNMSMNIYDNKIC